MKVFQLFLVATFEVLLVFGGTVQELRLIKTSIDGPAVWMTETEIWDLIKHQKHFIDITDSLDAEGIKEKPDTSAIPKTLQYQPEMSAVLSHYNVTRVQDFIKHFTSFHSRYYESSTGVQSQKWLYSQIQDSISDYVGSVSVREFRHSSWPQNSIIARIEGADPILKSEVIILGAHLDSVNLFGSRFRAPGADDNAAGSVVVLESLRSIVNSNFIPKRTIEFHWYAAEEAGLRGSAAVAQSYKQDSVNVLGMVNFDVPGYHNGKDEIGIYTDNSEPALADFLRILVDEYLDYGRKDETCGYGCSDHASWTRYGYSAAMPAEVSFHPLMHTAYDDYSRVNFQQVREFVKLALGFCVEFGQPMSQSQSVESILSF